MTRVSLYNIKQRSPINPQNPIATHLKSNGDRNNSVNYGENC